MERNKDETRDRVRKALAETGDEDLLDLVVELNQEVDSVKIVNPGQEA